MAIVRDKVIDYINKQWFKKIIGSTGLNREVFQNMIDNKSCKFQKKTLDILYDFFRLEKDEFYQDNLKKWVMPTESILGEILRKKRLQAWMTIPDVQKIIKVDSRQIARIEAWDSLPSFWGYTMTKLLLIYEFTEEEREKIRWFITILKDLIIINHKL